MPDDILDLRRPFTELDEGSDPDIAGADFIEQDGKIYAWSDSNIRYELAWWLYASARECDLVRHLRETRRPAGLEIPIDG